jgi:hypothetical protein
MYLAWLPGCWGREVPASREFLLRRGRPCRFSKGFQILAPHNQKIPGHEQGNFPGRTGNARRPAGKALGEMSAVINADTLMPPSSRDRRSVPCNYGDFSGVRRPRIYSDATAAKSRWAPIPDVPPISHVPTERKSALMGLRCRATRCRGTTIHWHQKRQLLPVVAPQRIELPSDARDYASNPTKLRA